MVLIQNQYGIIKLEQIFGILQIILLNITNISIFWKSYRQYMIQKQKLHYKI